MVKSCLPRPRTQLGVWGFGFRGLNILWVNLFGQASASKARKKDVKYIPQSFLVFPGVSSPCWWLLID